MTFVSLTVLIKSVFQLLIRTTLQNLGHATALTTALGLLLCNLLGTLVCIFMSIKFQNWIVSFTCFCIIFIDCIRYPLKYMFVITTVDKEFTPRILGLENILVIISKLIVPELASLVGSLFDGNWDILWYYAAGIVGASSVFMMGIIYLYFVRDRDRRFVRDYSVKE